MQISSTAVLPPKASEVSSTDHARRTGAAGETKATTEKASSFAPTADLSQLLAALKQVPDVRTDAVQAATAKVNSGELTTPAAAHDAAAAALDDVR